MKKTINNISLSVLLLAVLYSCQQKVQEDNKTANEILQEVQNVIGIGKVIAAEGEAIVATTKTGNIKELYVKEGDTVKENQLLISLREETEDIDLSQNEAILTTLNAQNKINRDNLEKEKLLLAELENKYQTSLSLFNKNAETAENLYNDKSKYLQQQKSVQALQSQIQADYLKLNEQKLVIRKSKSQVEDLFVRAPKTGIITELSANVGQSISNSTTLAKIVNPDAILIEAEIDELMANKVQNGQKVIFHSVGRRDSIAEGTIIYTSPILSNKSILYETVGEGDDRRVRIVKIKPNKNLLINSKVECEIMTK